MPCPSTGRQPWVLTGHLQAHPKSLGLEVQPRWGKLCPSGPCHLHGVLRKIPRTVGNPGPPYLGTERDSGVAGVEVLRRWANEESPQDVGCPQRGKDPVLHGSSPFHSYPEPAFLPMNIHDISILEPQSPEKRGEGLLQM